MSEAFVERNKRVGEMYLAGQTLDAVGQHFGITRERVRQILVAQNIERRPAAPPKTHWEPVEYEVTVVTTIWRRYTVDAYSRREARNIAIERAAEADGVIEKLDGVPVKVRRFTGRKRPGPEFPKKPVPE